MQRSVFHRIMSALIAASMVDAATAVPPSWGSLKPGRYAVGFHSEWRFDESRRYNTTFDDKTTYSDGKAPRPILVNRWYPAVASPASTTMPHRGYLDIRSDDPRLTKFSEKLASFNRSVVAEEMFRKKLAEQTKEETAQLEAHFAAPTACVRDASPSPGGFPMVIYHSGAQSSFEDNAVLCEYLASHGFIVFGSAFQLEFGRSLATDNREGSAADFAFLIAQSKSSPGVDWRRIAIVGHSAGAQAALAYRATTNSAVDAIVSLDTTQDYHSLLSPGWDFARKAVDNAANFTCPLLMAAGPTAHFEMADALVHSKRRYVTVKGLDHNDFIDQGIAARERRLALSPQRDAAEERIDLEVAKRGYAALCECILDFLNAELNGSDEAKGKLDRRSRNFDVAAGEPNVETVPSGESRPKPYEDDGRPPTPRQWRRCLNDRGRDAAIALFDRYRASAPAHPIFDSKFQLNLVGDLLHEGRREDAVALHRYFRTHGLDCVKHLCQYGALFERIGNRKGAARYFEHALTLDPQNAEAKEKLQKLRAEPQKR